jgi:hypothetical protein
MKFTGWWWLVLIPVALLAVHWSDSAGQEESRPKPPPLSVEALLNEVLPDAPKNKIKLNVDNSSCYVCHNNYEEEELVLTHGQQEIGCIDCHGESLDHRNDEDNITPPDILYPLDAIDEKCSECHDEHDASAKDVIKRWQKRCPQKTDANDLVCTDCHFHHRLEKRIVRWNKTTKELIVETPN